MSIYDSPNLWECTGKNNYRTVGIMKLVGKTNKYKSHNLNGYIGLMNRKVFNVK